MPDYLQLLSPSINCTCIYVFVQGSRIYYVTFLFLVQDLDQASYLTLAQKTATAVEHWCLQKADTFSTLAKWKNITLITGRASILCTLKSSV